MMFGKEKNMCLNCGCKSYDDHMADDRNLTLKELAKAAIANDMPAGETMNNIKDALEHITPDMLQGKIEKVKESEESIHP